MDVDMNKGLFFCFVFVSVFFFFYLFACYFVWIKIIEREIVRGDLTNDQASESR